MLGENGDDQLDGGVGNDFMYGGLGNDTFFVDSTEDQVLEEANEGNDIVMTSVSYELAGRASVQILRTTDNAWTVAIDLTGNGHVNTLIGNAGDNVLDGKGDADPMPALRATTFISSTTQTTTFTRRPARAETQCARRSDYGLDAGFKRWKR